MRGRPRHSNGFSQSLERPYQWISRVYFSFLSSFSCDVASASLDRSTARVERHLESVIVSVEWSSVHRSGWPRSLDRFSHLTPVCRGFFTCPPPPLPLPSSLISPQALCQLVVAIDLIYFDDCVPAPFLLTIPLAFVSVS